MSYDPSFNSPSDAGQLITKGGVNIFRWNHDVSSSKRVMIKNMFCKIIAVSRVVGTKYSCFAFSRFSHKTMVSVWVMKSCLNLIKMVFIYCSCACVCRLTDIKLRSYQLKGVDWLVSRLDGGHGCILADEMGLGKTCQVQ